MGREIKSRSEVAKALVRMLPARGRGRMRELVTLCSGLAPISKYRQERLVEHRFNGATLFGKPGKFLNLGYRWREENEMTSTIMPVRRGDCTEKSIVAQETLVLKREKSFYSLKGRKVRNGDLR